MKLYLGVFAFCVWMAGCLNGIAADPGKTAPPRAITTAPDTKAAWDRRIAALDADNLPLEEIVKQLRNDFPELNFLLRPGSADRELRGVSVRLQIRNVTLAEIIKAIELAAEMPIQVTATPEDRLVVFDFKHKPADTFAQSPMITRAYSLASYLSGLDEKEAEKAMQELYNAIEISARMMVEATNGERQFKAKLQMHRGTKLLIAVGRADELEIVNQIAEQLRIPAPGSSRAGSAPPDGPSAKSAATATR